MFVNLLFVKEFKYFQAASDNSLTTSTTPISKYNAYHKGALNYGVVAYFLL